MFEYSEGKPLVSIIIPVYNTEKYLAKCLNCMINQTYKELEIICMNDGSKDNSLSILEEYAKKDSRIHVYNQENSGASSARNNALKYATGKYIAFIDSDDTCASNSIESSVEIAEKNECDLIATFLNIRYKQELQPIDKISYLSTFQIFVKKSLLDENPDIRYNKNLAMGEDSVFSHKLIAIAKNFSKNLEAKYSYNLYPEQSSAKINANHKNLLLSNIKLWMEDLVEFYNKHELWDKKKEHFLNFIIEQPFTEYLRIQWDKTQRKELKMLIFDVFNKYNFKLFRPTNKREWLFNIFIKDKIGLFFNCILLFAKLYIKIIDIIKKRESIKLAKQYSK